LFTVLEGNFDFVSNIIAYAGGDAGGRLLRRYAGRWLELLDDHRLPVRDNQVVHDVEALVAFPYVDLVFKDAQTDPGEYEPHGQAA
jgi:hypothetical protein